jgi:hypothetical protein
VGGCSAADGGGAAAGELGQRDQFDPGSPVGDPLARAEHAEDFLVGQR